MCILQLTLTHRYKKASKYHLEIQVLLPCSAVVPGAAVLGTGVGEVEAFTAVASVTVDESDEIEVVWV